MKKSSLKYFLIVSALSAMTPLYGMGAQTQSKATEEEKVNEADSPGTWHPTS